MTTNGQTFDKQFVRNRAFIIDWLVQLKHKLDYSDETLFIAISILDKVLLNFDNKIKASEIYFISLICIFIAGKYFEVEFVSLDDILIQIGQGKFEKSKFLEMELKILKLIKFKIPRIHFYEFMNNMYDTFIQDENKKTQFLKIITSAFIFSLYNFNLKFITDTKTLYYSIFYFSLNFFQNKKLVKSEIIKKMKNEKLDIDLINKIMNKINFLSLNVNNSKESGKVNDIFCHFKNYEMSDF